MNKLLMIQILFFAVFAFAKEQISFPKIDDVISCSMNAKLTHRLSKVDEEYMLYVSFPLYLKEGTAAEQKASKKRWADWDGEGANMPKEIRKMAVAVPVESGNVMSFDKERMSKRIKFFEKIFPDSDAAGFIPIETG